MLFLKIKLLFFNYTEWVKCYIRAKKDFTKRSIVNNRLVVNYTDDASLSKRKIVLREWADVLRQNKEIDLQEYEKMLFGVENPFYIDPNSNVDYLVEAREDKKVKELFISFKFNFAVKRALQVRQKELFGKGEGNSELRECNRNDNKLSVYFTEAVKYFEHYFPIKNKNGKKVLTMDDAKYYLEEKTIKETIANQIENAVRLQLLQQGKSQFHKYNDDTNSSTLAKNKRDEFFVLNLVEACAFASNNIRNIVDENQKSDILVKSDLIDSIKERKFNSVLFNQFYKYKGSETLLKEGGAQQLEQTIWALRGSVQMIRNSIIHYKTDAIDNIFKIDKFEYPQKEDIYYTQTIFKNALAYDIDNLPQVFVEQLSSNDILKYYNSEDIELFLNTCEFSLCRSSIPFAPGFKTIYNVGFKLQEQENPLKLKYYHLYNNAKDTKIANAYSAYRFLLKLLYNHCFLPNFLDEKKNRTSFKDAVDYTLKNNKPERGFAYAFKDIPYMGGLSIADYMSNIHSLAIQEKNKKDEKEGEQRINTQRFIEKVFAKGFDNFLKGLNLNFLLSPIQVAKDDDVKDEYTKLCKFVNVGHTIDKESNSHIAFYTFCKLLDAVHLSDLRNELIKYKSSDIDGSFDLEYVINIIELCLLNVDRVDNIVADTLKIKWKEDLNSFVDESKLLDDKTENGLYIQSDNYTPVVHASIAVIRKYGTMPILRTLVEKEPKGKITKNDYKEWNGFKTIASDNKVSQIERLIKEREDIHKQWENINKNIKDAQSASRNREDKTLQNQARERAKQCVQENKMFIATNKSKYIKTCANIERYNWLDNKLHLVHLKRLHNLTIQILSRLARLVALWDRDFVMFDSNLVGSEYKLEKIDTLELFKKILPEATNPKVINRKKEIRSGLKSSFKRNNVQKTDDERDVIVDYIDSKLPDYCSFFDIVDKRKIHNRNAIAHYNYISKFEENTYSLLDLIANLRDLMQYDRKLRNAVTKSIINVFEQNGMILKLEVIHDKKEEIKVKSVIPKTILHLSDKDITSPLVSIEYCNLCKVLLEMKK